MKLVRIPKDKYDDYRLSAIFEGYKWDPQFLDDNTVADHVLVITQEEDQILKELVVNLGKETEASEILMNKNHKLMKDLKLPFKMKRMLKKMSNYNPEEHIRLMRFDFHPCTDGSLMISEVNSDVPGGFAEASLIPQIALNYLDSKDYHYTSFGDVLMRAVKKKVKPKGNIMMVHCTSYTDDRQVMQYFGDALEKEGFTVLYGAADHVVFKNKKATSILSGYEMELDAIIRFNPIEWVVDIKDSEWHGYFDTKTPSCNHPVTVLCQSKRFPLIWDALEKEGIDLSTWRKTLPHTTEVKEVKGNKNYLYKPVWGRVGEGITVKGAVPQKELDETLKELKTHPKRYVAQHEFDSQPLYDEDGNPYHLCIGAYYVEGEAAGYYGRISKTRRIDSHAKDIPVLVMGGKDE